MTRVRGPGPYLRVFAALVAVTAILGTTLAVLSARRGIAPSTPSAASAPPGPSAPIAAGASGGGGGAATATPATGRSTSPSFRVVQAVPGAGPWVALTFDAGWEFSNCTALLDVLAARKVTATFFLRGQWASDHTGLAQAIVAAGHQVGNHSLTHADMATLGWEDVRKEEAGGAAAIVAATGTGPPDLFRPPYGSYTPDTLRLLREQGYRAMVMWDVDSLDWTGLATDALVTRVLSMVKPGSVVLMHIGGENTVKALPAILDGLAARGLQPVTVRTLLNLADGLPPGESAGGLPGGAVGVAASEIAGRLGDASRPAAGDSTRVGQGCVSE